MEKLTSGNRRQASNHRILGKFNRYDIEAGMDEEDLNVTASRGRFRQTGNDRSLASDSTRDNGFFQNQRGVRRIRSDAFDDDSVDEEQEEEIVAEGRDLLTRFVVAEMEKEGNYNLVQQFLGRMMHNSEVIASTSAPQRPLVFNPQCRSATLPRDQIVDALTRIGDALEHDNEFNRMIDTIPPDASWDTFRNVAAQLFADEINWGRIVALFYFAFKMIRRSLGKMPVVTQIFEWMGKLIKCYLAHWIISRGGWRAVVEWWWKDGIGPAWSQIGWMFGIFSVSLVVMALKSRN